MKRLAVLLFLLPGPAWAQTGAAPALVGQYRLAEGPDVAGALDIGADHRFRYRLAAGALDERAEGRWELRDGRACLFTEPRPVPPTFALAPPAPGQRATLLVTGPNGQGIAGVDFRLGFARGEPIEGYTQSYGWTVPRGERRRPQWVELAVPMHGLRSPRIALAGRAKARVVLTPNDLGVVDFQGECLSANGGRFVLPRGGGEMRFVRVGD